ncbi:MAG: hypothetical protein LBT74_08360 [Acidobacteriota bacterium]|jgi:hypothetical protein|nr:hypothetical protein [Acidobacteriota bacterium]
MGETDESEGKTAAAEAGDGVGDVGEVGECGDVGFEDAAPEEGFARPLFPHRPWMTGVVLILAVLAILGGTVDPLWFGVGLPFILVLALYAYIRVRDWRRGKRSDLPE